MTLSKFAITWLCSLSLLLNTVAATITDIPGIYGPIYSVMGSDYIDPSQHLKSKPGDFVHPGIWHTHEDLERMRTNINAGKEPWKSAFAAFSTDSYSQSTYTMQGPHAVLSRGAISNYTSFTNDARAAWQNALMWYITRSSAHWTRSTTILDAWGSNLTAIIGTDRSLLIGLDGDMFVNAAEIMRWEGGWTEAGAKWQGSPGFANQIYWLFSRQSTVVGQANYGMASIKAMMSFAVYLDDVMLWNYAVNEYLNNKCAGAPWTWEPETGQSVESGRDQSTFSRLSKVEECAMEVILIQRCRPCHVRDCVGGLRRASCAEPGL
ncbi:chondroitin AC/alginate lyase [Bimuria novae-zelandiae CBS 107.79]|uniref:Chondroitin AC/alginate lyase n=1 Tax=Bimuria novae-zelandiae CBS 107.79 TaxID=1447943 RepID=A0A6A5UYY8_9PLEO|nr:chondroitin AC/alginate lyase [Bimuria novae-zelandiae CBS 107.79]